MAKESDAKIAGVAARQHGVVTLRQLRDAGLTVDMVRSRVRSGQIRRLHQGVYLLGSLIGPLRPTYHREMAAVLACGRQAAVSHQSALWLHGLTDHRPRGPVHLSLERRRCRRPGIVAHRVAALPDTDVGTRDGIPTTRPIRTILDLADAASPRELERLIARAERAGHLDIVDIRTRVKVEDGRNGIRTLRAVVDTPTAPAFTRSEAEEHFLQLVHKAKLPPPECNVTIAGRELDFFWRDARVAVEVDGFAYHASRGSFEHDRDRDLALSAEGIEVHRVTWRQIHDEPFVLVRRLASTLTRAQVHRARTLREAHP